MALTDIVRMKVGSSTDDRIFTQKNSIVEFGECCHHDQTHAILHSAISMYPEC